MSIRVCVYGISASPTITIHLNIGIRFFILQYFVHIWFVQVEIMDTFANRYIQVYTNFSTLYLAIALPVTNSSE